MKPIIQLNNVNYRYSNRASYALKNISIDVYPQQFITILGPNGSGKSTLAKVLNGLLIPEKGDVIVDHIYTTKETNDLLQIRKLVGMVFQNPDNQLVANTVEEDVAFGLENQGIAIDTMRRLVDQALEKVGLSNFKTAEPHHLSGGQKQKVAIAGIIAMRPKVIILDEATSMLDPKGRDEVLKTIKQLNQEEKITVIQITHHLQETIFSDRIMIMNQGEILLDGSPKQVLSERDTLKEVGLEVPLAGELVHRLLTKGYPFSQNIITNEEFVQELWTLL